MGSDLGDGFGTIADAKTIAELGKRIADLERQLSEAKQDSERLDWVEVQRKVGGWVDLFPFNRTVRQVIDEAKKSKDNNQCP